jgi:hypothetical protein
VSNPGRYIANMNFHIFGTMQRPGKIFLFLFFIGNIQAQVFHFVDTSTTIIKDITQSPAHWYLEIYNDLNVEDTLRWKAHFVNIPSQWDINFDTQSGYWDPVLDGDSADFVLMDSLDFPQKLIIGNATNLTVGHGSVFMDIYDPQNPTDLVTIEYEFIITEVGAGIEDELISHSIFISANQIQFNFSKTGHYSLYSSSGQLLKTESIQSACDLSLQAQGLYIVQVQIGEKQIVKKFIR